MKKTYILILTAASALLGALAFAGMPVIDAANLANSQISHIATIAKWVENIAQLKTQITQLKEQVNIQDQLRNWTGNPSDAAKILSLGILNESDFLREYGLSRDDIARVVQSLDTLSRTDGNTYRSIHVPDLDGATTQYDPLTYRRHALLDARADNTRAVTDQTQKREHELQEEIALTLSELRAGATDAQVQKLTAKLIVLNGQLSQIETTRRRQMDEVVLQKIANDNRRETEQLAAAELGSRDDFLANQRVTAFMRSINPRKNAR
jgi:conjugal transfer/entry exclusion protein